ncbi:hypothetical protein ACFIOY_21785 [Bradyrhizobium sp. TZ2]
MAGLMKDFSKTECLRVHKMLEDREAKGIIKHVMKGNPSAYQIVRTG